MKWLPDRVHFPALLWVYGAVSGIPVCRPFFSYLFGPYAGNTSVAELSRLIGKRWR